MHTFVSAFICLGFARCAIGVTAEPPNKARPDYEVRLQVKIPMRDGVRLNATVYLPKPPVGAPSARTPVIFTLTPYISDTYHERGSYFASHGYVFALVDTRGRGNSEGAFEPFIHEAHDGYDVVEWFAQQLFCDGHVAMWGGSYAGFDQWATAKELPPHLSTIVPAAAAHPGVDVPFYNNIGQPYLVQWLTDTDGRAAQNNLFRDFGFWTTKFLEAYRQHIPFKSLDSFIGNSLPNFQHLIAHPSRDSYYDQVCPSADQFRKITIPSLTITGQYDDDEFGAMTYYRDHFAHGDANALTKHYLLIGPWDHCGTRTPTDETGGVKFGPAALVDLNRLHLQWYDWTMRHGARPELLRKPVTYYVLAPGNSGVSGEWRYADNFAALTAETQTYYLDSRNGDANGVFHSGTLTLTHPQPGADSYTYDPLDLHRGELVDTIDNSKTADLDETYPRSLSKDGLAYHTDPLPEGMELVGCPSLKLWLSLDTPDTDLEANLYEIQPDGTSIWLWNHAMRLRYRESTRRPLLVRPNEAVACNINPGLFIARKLMKGSRLRLTISSPNTIWAEKNYNYGGVVAQETAKDARTTHITIYHDNEHASSLHVALEATLAKKKIN